MGFILMNVNRVGYTRRHR